MEDSEEYPRRITLERGWRTRRLILDLAKMEKNQDELAREYGVQQPAISRFAARHADEIEDRKAKIEDDLYGLWIADKSNRVAEYQDDVEAINGALTHEPDEKLLRAKLAIMRQVAEELGQLKTNVEVSGRLTYVVEGIDMGALR